MHFHRQVSCTAVVPERQIDSTSFVTMDNLGILLDSPDDRTSLKIDVRSTLKTNTVRRKTKTRGSATFVHECSHDLLHFTLSCEAETCSHPLLHFTLSCETETCAQTGEGCRVFGHVFQKKLRCIVPRPLTEEGPNLAHRWFLLHRHPLEDSHVVRIGVDAIWCCCDGLTPKRRSRSRADCRFRR